MKLNTRLLSIALALAAGPAAGAPRPAVSALELSPQALHLRGKGAGDRVFVTAVLTDGSRKDVTEQAHLKASPGVVRLSGREVQAVKDGRAAVKFRYGGREAVLPVTVTGSQANLPPSFRYDILPIVSKFGCNQGSCHGNSEGKGGLKLSLKGEDPSGDYDILVRHGGGRRVNRAEPGASLLLLKATSTVPHGGGPRFKPGSEAYRTVAAWLASGAPDDAPDAPRLTRLEVTPREQILVDPARMLRLTVRGRFSDGSIRNLGRLAYYSPGDPTVPVSEDGVVSFDRATDLAVLVRYADQMQSARLTFVRARKAFAWKAAPEANWIDTLNFRRLKALRLQPSDLSNDTEFLRRAYLDTLGLLPTPDEARAFLKDPSPDRRARLIDALLQRPEFDDLWTMRWSDVLRVEERTLDPKGAAAYRDWIRQSIAADKPFDQFTRELLTGTGSTYANPPANYYRRTRTADELAETTAQVFMGTRLLCAKCHNHPFERWKQDDYYSLAAFFPRLDRKIENLTRRDEFDLHERIGEEFISVTAQGEVTHPRTNQPAPPGLPGWLPAVSVTAATEDRREPFAEWLTRGDNPFFARAIVNRVWYHLLGKGIVDPVDDLRESNPASNPELLDALARDFAANGYRLRHTVRTIMLSRTYQLSSEPNATNTDDERFFSRSIAARIPAEQLLDAMSQVTEAAEDLAPNAAGRRAVNLIPVNKQRHPFLKLFGQPARESACECERTNETTLGQSFALISGTAIDQKLKKPDNRIGRLLKEGKDDGQIITELYLAALSRGPELQELNAAFAYLGQKPDRRAALEDLLWALLNSKEFLLRR